MLPWLRGKMGLRLAGRSSKCLRSAALRAEMNMIQEKAPGNDKGAGGTRTRYVTCRSQCENKNVASCSQMIKNSRQQSIKPSMEPF